jgi:7-cyano-7-deazaguanine synthase
MTNTPKTPAIVLLSGGLDSATVLAMANAQGYSVHAMSFDYGQRHRVELERAAELARRMGAVEHQVVKIDLRAFGGSSLTSDIAVRKGHTAEDIAAEADSNAIPSTYVPARNIIFLSFALGLAEVRGARDIFLGVNALDYSGYPDCRPEFLAAFAQMANLGTAQGVRGDVLRFHAPLMALDKAGIIREGLKLGVDYGLTTSCYDPSPEGKPCGGCDSCVLREKGFQEAGQTDPLITRFGVE